MVKIDLSTLATAAGTAAWLCESLVPAIVIEPWRKRPLTGPDGGQVVIDDPDEAALAFIDSSNVGMMLWPKAGSSIVVVDVDGPDGKTKLTELGIDRSVGCWQWRTGRGGLGLAFWKPDCDLPRTIRAEGHALDLLTNGYVIVPPSDTSRWRDSRGRAGGRYSWFDGHTPWDIPASELEPLPDVLVEFWLAAAERRKAPSNPPDGVPASGTAWRLVGSPIPTGERNDTLTRVAGWLRLYHPPPVVEELLLAINDARCHPPLAESEVRGIARSVGRYDQPGVNGHPAAIIPGQWVHGQGVCS